MILKFINKMFDFLSKYKKVDSYGRYKNNMGAIGNDFASDDYIKLISQYKFIICFENKKVESEKNIL